MNSTGRLIITIRPTIVYATIEYDRDGLHTTEYSFMNIGHCLAHFGGLLPVLGCPIHVRYIGE